MESSADSGLQTWLIDRVVASFDQVDQIDDATLRRLVAGALNGSAVGARLSLVEKQRLAEEVLHAMRGLGILQPLYDDPSVTEIMVNGPDAVFFERDGRLHRYARGFPDRKRLTDLIVGFFARSDRSISESEPLADLRLPNGSRAHAALPPVAPDGPVFTIRKFTGICPDLETLVHTGFLSQDAADFLQAAVRERHSLFISGGTGTGKTTFLNVLSASIPSDERVVTIEDSAELRLQGLPDLVRLEARGALPDGGGAVGLSQLIRASLRMRPDRILVGEVRGAEALDMLQAMNTGHAGSLSTGHANSAEDMLVRLATLALAPSGLPYAAVVRQVASAVELVVHLVRLPDGRRVVREVIRTLGPDGESFRTETLFSRKGGGPLVRTF
jgi:pilus assembly protein CpaF